MSKGIGEKYLNEHKDEILKTDSIICAGGREKRPPRYFDKILDKDTNQDTESYFKAHSDELREVRASHDTERNTKFGQSRTKHKRRL